MNEDNNYENKIKNIANSDINSISFSKTAVPKEVTARGRVWTWVRQNIFKEKRAGRQVFSQALTHCHDLIQEKGISRFETPDIATWKAAIDKLIAYSQAHGLHENRSIVDKIQELKIAFVQQSSKNLTHLSSSFDAVHDLAPEELEKELAAQFTALTTGILDKEKWEDLLKLEQLINRLDHANDLKQAVKEWKSSVEDLAIQKLVERKLYEPEDPLSKEIYLYVLKNEPDKISSLLDRILTQFKDAKSAEEIKDLIVQFQHAVPEDPSFFSEKREAFASHIFDHFVKGNLENLPVGFYFPYLQSHLEKEGGISDEQKKEIGNFYRQFFTVGEDGRFQISEAWSHDINYTGTFLCSFFLNYPEGKKFFIDSLKSFDSRLYSGFLNSMVSQTDDPELIHTFMDALCRSRMTERISMQNLDQKTKKEMVMHANAVLNNSDSTLQPLVRNEYLKILARILSSEMSANQQLSFDQFPVEISEADFEKMLLHIVQPNGKPVVLVDVENWPGITNKTLPHLLRQFPNIQFETEAGFDRLGDLEIQADGEKQFKMNSVILDRYMRSYPKLLQNDSSVINFTKDGELSAFEFACRAALSNSANYANLSMPALMDLRFIFKDWGMAIGKQLDLAEVIMTKLENDEEAKKFILELPFVQLKEYLDQLAEDDRLRASIISILNQDAANEIKEGSAKRGVPSLLQLASKEARKPYITSLDVRGKEAWEISATPEQLKAIARYPNLKELTIDYEYSQDGYPLDDLIECLKKLKSLERLNITLTNPYDRENLGKKRIQQEFPSLAIIFA